MVAQKRARDEAVEALYFGLQLQEAAARFCKRSYSQPSTRLLVILIRLLVCDAAVVVVLSLLVLVRWQAGGCLLGSVG